MEQLNQDWVDEEEAGGESRSQKRKKDEYYRMMVEGTSWSLSGPNPGNFY